MLQNNKVAMATINIDIVFDTFNGRDCALRIAYGLYYV